MYLCVYFMYIRRAIITDEVHMYKYIYMYVHIQCTTDKVPH